MLRGTRAALIALALLMERAALAQSDATGQLWGNLTLDWHKSPRVTYSLDLEPKALVSGPPDQPGWANIDLTPSAEFAAAKWIDLVGEGVFGRTAQTDDLETTELSARAGARFHLFSRQQRVLFNEHLTRCSMRA